MLLEPLNMQRYFVNIDDIITLGRVAGTLFSRPNVVVSVLMSTEMTIAHFVSPYYLLLPHLINEQMQKMRVDGVKQHALLGTYAASGGGVSMSFALGKGGIRNSSWSSAP